MPTAPQIMAEIGAHDGFRPQGAEDADGIKWRRGLLRKIGYKF